MARLLFDTPWWFPTILIFLGGFLFWTGNQRQETKIRAGGLALILAAIAVILLSWFVDTDAEKAVKAAKGMVTAVEQHDWTKLRNLLGPNATLAVINGPELYANRNEIVAAAQKAVDQYGLKNTHVISTHVDETDQLIAVTMTVISEQDFTQGRPLNTSWKLEWERSGSTWVLVRITCIQIGNLNSEGAAQQFPRLR
jgi:hypothetical protein